MNHVGLSLRSEGDAPPDIHLDASNQLALVRDAEAVGQRVNQRLGAFHNEWFLDLTAGVTWLDDKKL